MVHMEREMSRQRLRAYKCIACLESFHIRLDLQQSKMLPTFALVSVGLFSLAAGQLTSSQINKFRSNGVVVMDKGDSYTFSHVGIPTDHPIGNFPNTDNPNSASAQNHEFEVPKTPTPLSEPGCLSMGPIAVSVNGIPIYNPFTGEGTNAVENEVFDSCAGHPDASGTYHYHMLPNCVYEGDEDELVGVAFDGYPIYGPKTSGGTSLTTSDLDQCHGQTRDGQYEYRITTDFPYILGCYKGETLSGGTMGGGMMDGGMMGGDRPERPEGEDGEKPERPEGGMEEGMGGGMDRDWSTCYALVGCENPADQVGDAACDSGAGRVGIGMSVLVTVALSLAAWVI